MQTSFIFSILRAIRRARVGILTIAATYAISIAVGIIMVHAGNSFALDYGNRLVGQAQKGSTLQAVGRNENLKAAFLDFGGNLFIGAIPKTVTGIAVIGPYPFVAYQGWIGGIVSVRRDHSSRLNDIRSATYYLVTLLLQVLAYSLAIGGGVNLGVAMLKPAGYYQDKKWLSLFPREALRDLARIYVLVVPIFLIASMWEFLGPWNF